eukprot:PhM_4_TR13141/c0_g1_i1/m.58402
MPVKKSKCRGGSSPLHELHNRLPTHRTFVCLRFDDLSAPHTQAHVPARQHRRVLGLAQAHHTHVVLRVWDHRAQLHAATVVSWRRTAVRVDSVVIIGHAILTTIHVLELVHCGADLQKLSVERDARRRGQDVAEGVLDVLFGTQLNNQRPHSGALLRIATAALFRYVREPIGSSCCRHNGLADARGELARLGCQDSLHNFHPLVCFPAHDTAPVHRRGRGHVCVDAELHLERRRRQQLSQHEGVLVWEVDVALDCVRRGHRRRRCRGLDLEDRGAKPVAAVVHDLGTAALQIIVIPYRRCCGCCGGGGCGCRCSSLIRATGVLDMAEGGSVGHTIIIICIICCCCAPAAKVRATTGSLSCCCIIRGATGRGRVTHFCCLKSNTMKNR